MVQAKAHQIIHNVVIAGYFGEHALHKLRFLLRGDLLKAEIHLVVMCDRRLCRHAVNKIFGDPDAIRTRDLLIKSQLLYRLSYGI